MTSPSVPATPQFTPEERAKEIRERAIRLLEEWQTSWERGMSSAHPRTCELGRKAAAFLASQKKKGDEMTKPVDAVPQTDTFRSLSASLGLDINSIPNAQTEIRLERERQLKAALARVEELESYKINADHAGNLGIIENGELRAQLSAIREQVEAPMPAAYALYENEHPQLSYKTVYLKPDIDTKWAKLRDLMKSEVG